MTHDYKRNGTTTLFAALNLREGIVIDKCLPRQRHQEWSKLLEEIDARTPPRTRPASDRPTPYSQRSGVTNKHSKMLRWLKRYMLSHMRYIPTFSSWLNLVERFFADLTSKRLRRSSLASALELIQVIEGYVQPHNEATEGFEWKATADDILE